MRILHVIPSVGPVRGGPSQAVLELVSAIRPLGVDAEIACTNDNGPDVLQVPTGSLMDYQGVPVRFFPRFSPSLRALREFALSAPLTRWLRGNLGHYDLIHVHAFFSYASSAAMFLARKCGQPYINRPSGLLGHWALKQSRLRKRAFLALMDRANLEKSAALEYTSELERDEAARLHLKPPAFVLPYGLDVPPLVTDAAARLRARFHIPEDEPVLLFLSRLHPKKGLHYLIEALGALPLQPFHLVIAGSGEPDYETSIREQVAQRALRHRVHFAGFAGGEDKQLLLQGADLFVLPSHSESFAIAALEAVAAGTPVLTTRDVPVALLVEKSGLGWVTGLQPSELALSVERALKQCRTLSRDADFRARGRRLVERNFSWSIIAARTIEVYNAVLENRQPPSFELSAAQV
jgi:glycosyltransferase involved in cell wall biosynthesis